MSTIAGLLHTDNALTTDLVGEYQESIFVRNSKGMNVGTTLFGLMSRLKSEPAENMEFNWWERDPVKKTCYSSAIDLAASGTVRLEGALGSGTIFAHLQTGHILHNHRTGEYIRLTETPSSDTLANVTRGFGATTAADTADGDVWTILTLGQFEGANPVSAVYEEPETKQNFIQTFNSTVEVTNAFKGSVLRTDIDGPLTDRRIQALELISRDIEFAYLFGMPLKVTGTGNNWYTGGIAGSKFVENSNSWGVQADPPTNGVLRGADTTGVVLKANLDLWLQQWMTVGSDTKLLFCGPSTYAAFSSYANSADNGYRIMQSEQVYGMHITVINTPFGEVNLAFHPLMKEAVGYNDVAVGIDLSHVVQKTFEPLFLEPNVQTPGNDSYKEQYRAKLGLKLRFSNAFGYASQFASIT